MDFIHFVSRLIVFAVVFSGFQVYFSLFNEINFIKFTTAIIQPITIFKIF